jgi:hypothetical protein
LSYQSTTSTRLKYIDNIADHPPVNIYGWQHCTIVDTLHHFYLILCSKTFPIIYKIIIK